MSTRTQAFSGMRPKAPAGEDPIEFFGFMLGCSKEAIDTARILAGRDHSYIM